MRVGRNDPCPCGSGKKYKNCCMLKERADQSAGVVAQRDYEELLDQMLVYSQGPSYQVDLASAFNLYWNGDYGDPAQVQLPQLDLLRFFEWYVFDFVTWKSQKRITELVLESERLTPSKRAMLSGWLEARASAYTVVDVSPGRSILLHDLLGDGEQRVQDAILSTIVQAEDVLVGRILRVGDAGRLAFAPTLLPSPAGAGLVAFIQRAWQGHRDSHYGAQFADFIGKSAFLFNHYLLQEQGTKPALPKYYSASAAMAALDKAGKEARPSALEELFQEQGEREREPEVPGMQTIAGGRLLVPTERPAPEAAPGERTAAGGKILLP